jgi:sugar (pentulose or hexulose) kinase
LTARAAIAVFDLGKTNSKLFVLSPEGRLLDQSRTKPRWHDSNGVRVLDDAALFEWMRGALASAVADHDVGRVMFSGHGCTFALVAENELSHPILDYEQEPPLGIARKIDALIPDYSETYSPILPLGFNYGRHILWLKERDPALVDNTDTILSYPQFWSWRFSGRKASEVSYLGCHSHLWAPLEDDFSSLVDRQGWRDKMPGFAKAGEQLGTYRIELEGGAVADIAVHNGVHDSNSALHYYRSLGFTDFTLVSTGTWVVIFNSSCPLSALDKTRDMLANVTVEHRPAPTIRFMGGREFDIARFGWSKSISSQSISSVIAKGIFALPSFAPGGPFPGVEGRFVGPEPSDEERAAAALIYVVLMTDHSLDLIRSSNPIVIDGGLVKTGLFAGLLAALRPGQAVFTSANAEGSAFGAAALVFEQIGGKPFPDETKAVASAGVFGLDAYRRAWRGLIEIDQARQGEAEKKELLA